MYSNLAEILLNSVPVLPSSASLPESSGFLQDSGQSCRNWGGDWKVLYTDDDEDSPDLLGKLTLEIRENGVDIDEVIHIVGQDDDD